MFTNVLQNHAFPCPQEDPSACNRLWMPYVATATIVTGLLDGIVGIIFGVGAIVTNTNECKLLANDSFKELGEAIPFAFAYSLNFFDRKIAASNLCSSYPRAIMQYQEGNLHWIREKISKGIDSVSKIDPIFCPRIGYVILGVACVVTRAVEGVFGLLAATGAILIGGTSRKLNQIAYNNLKFLEVVKDVVHCTHKVAWL